MEGETARRLRPVSDDKRESEQPTIWVCSVAAYRESVLYGGWVGAAQAPDELRGAIDALLAQSPIRGRGWAVLTQRGFNGLVLRHDEPLRSISRLALGVVHHGEPFAHWAEHRGFDDVEALDHFADRYLGRYLNLVAYVGHVVAETERSVDLAQMPPALRTCARYTINRLARRWALEVHATKATGGGWHLFDDQ